MADLKTTAEEREVIRWAHVATGSERAPTMRVLDDVDTLLAENAKLRAEMVKLRAVAAAARTVSRQFGDDYEVRLAPLDEALAALEAP